MLGTLDVLKVWNLYRLLVRVANPIVILSMVSPVGTLLCQYSNTSLDIEKAKNH